MYLVVCDGRVILATLAAYDADVRRLLLRLVYPD